MQVAIASAEVAKAAAAASKVAANVALQAKIVAAEAFSSSSLGPPLSTKNRFDLLSSTDERDVSMTYHVLEGFLICAFVVLNSNLSLRFVVILSLPCS